MTFLFLRLYRKISRPLFYVTFITGLLPFTLLAQFCGNGVTVAGGNGSGSEPNQFNIPLNVIVDAEGNLYVSDYMNHRVQKWAPGSSKGTTVAGNNGPGPDLNQLIFPAGTLLDRNGNLLVTEFGNHRVLMFPPNSTSATTGTLVVGGHEPGEAPTKLVDPTGLAQDSEGNLIVLCADRVVKFPPNSTSATTGTIVAGGNGNGDALNQFEDSFGFAFDAEGNLYVGDTRNQRVLKFPPNSTSATAGSIVAGGNGRGANPDQLNFSGNIAIDGAGNLYVADTENDRVLLFLPGSTSLTQGITVVGGNGEGSGPNQLHSPLGLFIDIDGSLYVADAENNRIQRFLPGTPTPAPVLSLSPSVPQPILQNTPFVTLAVSGCEGGTVSWQGPNGASGSGTTISVPTSTTGTLVYSATCTVGSCPSPPGSFTVTIIPSDITGSFDGFIYGADCSTFRGWAWERSKPNTVFSVDIFDGPKFLESIPANEFRQDLKDAGKGNGIHAFRWTISDALKDGKVHYLSARVAGSSFFLKDSPKALICESGTTSPPNKQPVAPTMTPLTAQQGVAFSTTLPAFTDPEGSTLSYGLVTLPTGLTFTSATRQITGTPTSSGLFTLAYSATDDKGATNSVSFPLTVNPAATTPVTGSFEGYLDKVECGTIRGWVWDRNKPNTPLTVEFYTGTTVWGSVVANIYRDDLKNAGKGNGAHAYSFDVPTGLKDGNTHLIRARVSGSTYDLKDSGKPLTCSSPAPVRLSAEIGPGFQVTVLGNPISGNFIEVEIRGAEGQGVRLDLRDTGGRPLSEYVIENAKTVERLSIPVHQRAAGLYLLHAASGSSRAVLKVLKP